MQMRIRALLFASAILMATSAYGQAVTDQPGASDLGIESPIQVLFVGNSYLYYNDSLHNHTSRMVREGEDIERLRYRSVTISGGSLSHHPFAHYLTPGAIGYKDPFDLVILQGFSAAANSDERRKAFRDAVLDANEQIKAHGAKTALYMTHAYAEGHDKYDPEMAKNLAELYTGVAAEIDALVIPVGLAFEKAREMRPDLELQVDFDYSHPNLAGSYLAAATVYATVYGASPVGLKYDYYGRLDAATASFLQQVAADTVAEFQGE